MTKIIDNLKAFFQKNNCYFVGTAVFVVGILFTVAGVSKLFPLVDFWGYLADYKFPLPFSFLQVCSIPLIIIEILLGLCLIFRSYLRGALFFTQILLLMMIPITIWGTIHDANACGCYGNLIMRSPSIATIEDILLLVISFYASHCIDSIREFKSIIFKIIIVSITVASAIYAASQLATQLCG